MDTLPTAKGGFLFDEPQCLIFTDDQNKLAINQPILDKIAEVSKQMNVVTIAGLYRTGKSYLLTRLAGRYKGFPLGSTIQSKTKGIWVWCLDHPIHKEQKLLLLDTEGLGDVMKGDANNDNQLFSLVTLLSSTLVYNTMGAFDQDALNKLHFITEMSKHILTSNNQDGGSTDHEFDMYFPEFILTLRDFTLELKYDDKDITSDQYLEYCLTLMPGIDDKTKVFNNPRSCMRKYFKRRKCFVFEQPAKRKQLHCLEELTDDELDEDFVRNVMDFKNYVHSRCQPFTLLDGTPVTGRMFTSLVRSYVTAIREGAVPCIQSALQSMAMQENEKTVADAVKSYKAGMEDLLTLPTEDEQIVLTASISCKEAAFEIFLRGSILDNDNVYKAEMDKRILEEYKTICLQNEKLSTEQCTNAITCLRSEIVKKITDGSYSKSGGSTLYKEDRDILKQKYFDYESLGVNRESSFVEFCKEWETEESGIYKSDMALTEQERLAEVERIKNEKIRNEEELYRKETEKAKIQMEKNYTQLETEIQRVNQRHENEIAIQKRNYDEMERKREEEINRLKTEQAKAIQNINERYEKDAKRHKNDMSMLQGQINERDAKMAQTNRKFEEQIEQAKDDRRKHEKQIEIMESNFKKQIEEERERIQQLESQEDSTDLFGNFLEAVVPIAVRAAELFLK